MTVLPADFRINLAIWIAVWATMIVWQVASATRSDRLASFGDVVGLARRSWALRWGLLVWWGWLGWHIFVQTHF